MTAERTGSVWRDETLLLVAAAACVAAPLAVGIHAPTKLRFVFVLLLFCFGPGAAIVPLLRGSIEIGLVVATSLGVVVVSAQGMLWLGLWHPRIATYVLALACLPIVVVSLLRSSSAAVSGRRRDDQGGSCKSWPFGGAPPNN